MDADLRQADFADLTVQRQQMRRAVQRDQRGICLFRANGKEKTTVKGIYLEAAGEGVALQTGKEEPAVRAIQVQNEVAVRQQMVQGFRKTGRLCDGRIRRVGQVNAEQRSALK